MYWNFKYNHLIKLAFLILSFTFFTITPAVAKPLVIKLAVVMPEGSTWTNIIYKLADEVKQQTKGEVSFKIYPGGISGDESDVLRKMRSNRIHAAGFSGVGLGYILPEIRILEAPLLFRDYKEVDYIKDKMFDIFAEKFEKKGYVLLGFAEAGFVYLFSKKEISSTEKLNQVKMWVWKGDRVAEKFLKAFEIKTYPLNLSDVITGFETGMIDSFYSPPLASIAFQWYPHITYMLDFPVVNSTGALLMNKRIFEKLSDKNQQLLKDLVGKYAKELVTLTRNDNEEAIEVLSETGVEMLAPSKDQVAQFQKNALNYHKESIPSLYSKELFDQIQSLLKPYRDKK